MWRLSFRSTLAIGAILVGLLPPRSIAAQSAADSVLLSLPGDSTVVCHEESNRLPQGAPLGTRAFSFEIGNPANVLRDATGRVFVPGMPPREISVAYDSSGSPLMLADLADITQWRHGAVVAYFPVGSSGFGFRQISQVDSAAAMARIRREGLGALQAATREATQPGPQEPLDSAAVGRARNLAVHLWAKRCP